MIQILTEELSPNFTYYQQVYDYFEENTVFPGTILEYFISKSGCISMAVDEGVIAGFSINFKVENHSLLLNNPAFMSYVENSGLDMSKLISACVYVKPEYSGQQLAHRMTLARSTHSLQHGYTHQVCFSFESPEIFAYTMSVGGNIDTGAIDEYGYPIIVRPIQAAINSMVSKGITQ